MGTEEAGQNGDLESMKVFVACRRDRGIPVRGYSVPDGERGGGGGHRG